MSATSWRFYHGGEKLFELADPSTTVLVEHAYRFGYRLVLYADGRAEIKPPE